MTTLEGAPVRYNQWDSLKAPKFVAAGDAHIDYVGLIPIRISTEQARVGRAIAIRALTVGPTVMLWRR